MKNTRNGFIKNLRYLCLVGVIVLGLMTIIGTGGGGGGGDGGPTTCEDVAGIWSTTEVVDARDCGDEGTYEEDNTYTVSQNGCNITVKPSTGGSYSGTVNGNQITWTGSWQEEGGTVNATINLTISGNSLSGSSSWTWSDGTESCSGTTEISGTRSTGDGTGVSLADLAGTWYGVQEDPAFVLETISVTIDGSGNITQILVDGENIGVTATVTKLSDYDQVFSYLDSEGTKGGFFVDASAGHAAFVDEDLYFGVVEKGASSLPSYAFTDIVAGWSGYGFALDSNLDISEKWTSSATVAGDYTFSGSNSIGENFNGSFTNFNSDYGRYEGNFSNSQGGSGPVACFLSPDKSFAASYAIDESGGGNWFEDVSFECWSQQ